MIAMRMPYLITGCLVQRLRTLNRHRLYFVDDSRFVRPRAAIDKCLLQSFRLLSG